MMSAAGSVTLPVGLPAGVGFRDRIEEHVRHRRARIVMVRRFQPAVEPALALVAC